MAPRNRNDNRRSLSSEGDYTRADLEREFPNDAACLDWLWRENYAWDGQHALCPRCDQVRKFHRVASRPSYSCDTCGHHIHPTAGTIFHKSSTGLDLWFRAVFLMSSTRCGISAKQLERDLGVTYKTAWRMAHLIRAQLMAEDEDAPLSGDVEMDEMYVGGRPRLADKAAWADVYGTERRQRVTTWTDKKKAKVFGMVERGGRVAAYVVPDTAGSTLMGHVTTRVLPASIIYTDEAAVYSRNVTRAGYDHKRIHHAAHVYVRGDVHTQTIEGFWSLVKRGIGGVYHSVSQKHLQGYLNEYTWRYNHRSDGEAMFRSLLKNAASSVAPGRLAAS